MADRAPSFLKVSKGQYSFSWTASPPFHPSVHVSGLRIFHISSLNWHRSEQAVKLRNIPLLTRLLECRWVWGLNHSNEGKHTFFRHCGQGNFIESTFGTEFSSKRYWRYQVNTDFGGGALLWRFGRSSVARTRSVLIIQFLVNYFLSSLVQYVISDVADHLSSFSPSLHGKLTCLMDRMEIDSNQKSIQPSLAFDRGWSLLATK